MFRNPDILSRLWNEEMEQSLIGCVLARPELYEDVAWFNPNWFYLPVHARIFEAIAEHKATGKAVSPAMIAQYFGHDEDLSMAGGEKYLMDMAEEYAWSRGAKDYAAHIRALHLRRMLVEKCDELKAKATNADPFTTPEQILEEAERLVTEAREVRVNDTTITAAESVKIAIKMAQNPARGIRTFSKLDAMTGGFKGSELTVIGGRPGMGKTAMGLTIAVNAALAGNRVLFFSLEMSHAQLMQRVLSRFSGQAVHSGDVSNSMESAIEKATKLHLDIDDASGLTALDIASRSTIHKRRKGLDMVVVDYLGLITPSDRKANKVHQVEEATQAMKRLSKDLGVPVVLLCQLSRAIEGRDDKRPGLSDLRDSGSIEQDADTVMFVYRQEYYDSATKPNSKFKGKNAEAAQMADQEADKDAAELIVAKNRQGRLGTVELRFNGEQQVFYEQ